MSLSYMVVFPFVNFPAVSILDKWGLRVGVSIGITLTTLGMWIRCLINVNYAYVLVGQTIMAIAQPFTYNAVAKVSGNWFGEKETVYATMIGANANLLGVALGFFVPSIFVGE